MNISLKFLRHSSVVIALAVATLSSHAALTVNALTTNALTANAITANALNATGRAADGLPPVPQSTELGMYSPSSSWDISTIRLPSRPGPAL